MRAAAIAGFVLKSADPRALAAFYADALGFLVESRSADVATLRLGPSRLEIERSTGRPYTDDVPGFSTLFQHFALATPNVHSSYDRLRNAAPGWTAISNGGPITLPASSGGVTAFKFRDPEGHPLELIQFPGDRGGPRIDHTAISVADRARSLAWYEALGFSMGGGSLNQGPTQAALDGLDGPVVDIVALAPPRPNPHLELLAYRTPAPRSDPPPAPDDIAATCILMSCTDEEADPAPFQDPDGHWLQWVAAQSAR